MSLDSALRISCTIRKRKRLITIDQADGSAMSNSDTNITRGLDLRIGSLLDHADCCATRQFAGEDLVILHKWLKTYQPHIPWGETKVTLNSRYCQEHGCSVILEKELDQLEGYMNSGLFPSYLKRQKSLPQIFKRSPSYLT